MIQKKSSLIFTCTVHAPANQVYRAFTNSTQMREWLCDLATTDPKPGGRVYLWWNSGYYASGEFTALTDNKLVAFTYFGRGEPRPTRVKISLKGKRASTQVTLTHAGLGSGEKWAKLLEQFKRGWELALENLASVVGEGPDLRIVRRPMLGITLSDFDAEIARGLAVPVKEGIRIDGTLEGMGARLAGLQKDDVIVSIAGQETKSYPELTEALTGKFAGDVVQVGFYRGPQKMTTDMKLSARPIPEIPGNVAELAARLQKMYDDAQAHLEGLLQGVSEAEAAYKPAADEWSVKETLAHLIHSERGLQNYIGETIGSQSPIYDDYAGNRPERNAATLAAFPTLPALLDELKRLNVESLALFSKLPKTFVARKGSYWNLAYGALQGDIHTSSHLEQMREAIEAARKR